MPRIFISYRRQDSSNMTGRIHDSLVREFGDRSVFRDVYDIPAGSDFRKILNKEVSQGDIFLAIIGSQWVGITDSQGNRRLDDPNDFVRIEVESALKNPQTRVIPVLVNNANMPVADELPEGLKELCYRNAVKVRTDPDFPHDMEMLLRQIKPSRFLSTLQKGWPVFLLGMILIAGIFLAPAIKGLFVNTTPALTETPTATLQTTDEYSVSEEQITPTPLVDPVEPGQVMVLVAQFEQVGSQERNVTRFIKDDLSQRLEVELPFTNIRVREYKGIITSNSEALQISEQTQAEIVVWGYYDSDGVTANIQLGSLESHPNMVLEREILESNANIRVKIADERQETLANQVLTSLSAIYIGENESLKMVLLIMALDMLNAPNPEMIGISNATHVHTGMRVYLSDEQIAINELTQAIEIDADNPILYVFRGMLYQRTGNFDLSEQDTDTAILLGPDDWVIPYHLKGNRSLLENNPANGIENYSKVIEKRPEDWFAYNMRGYFYFLAQQYDLAREDIEKSIELGPEAEYPYMWAALIAIRQGRLSDAAKTLGVLSSERPDPVFAERYMTALYGERYARLLGKTIAAMGHFALGQHNVVIQDVDDVLSIAPNYPDMYLLKGLSYCNQDDYPNAEDAYTQGLMIDPTFTMLYFLRAEVRGKLGDVNGATEDLAIVGQSDISENLMTYVEAAQKGRFSCKDMTATK